jgi:hypothetical protein
LRKLEWRGGRRRHIAIEQALAHALFHFPLAFDLRIHPLALPVLELALTLDLLILQLALTLLELTLAFDGQVL